MYFGEEKDSECFTENENVEDDEEFMAEIVKTKVAFFAYKQSILYLKQNNVIFDVPCFGADNIELLCDTKDDNSVISISKNQARIVVELKAKCFADAVEIAKQFSERRKLKGIEEIKKNGGKISIQEIMKKQGCNRSPAPSASAEIFTKEYDSQSILNQNSKRMSPSNRDCFKSSFPKFPHKCTDDMDEERRKPSKSRVTQYIRNVVNWRRKRRNFRV